MSNRSIWLIIFTFIGVYFFKADLFYFAHQITLEKNIKVQNLQHDIFLLQKKIQQLPLQKGKVITQLKGDIIVLNKVDLPIRTTVFGKKSVIGQIIKHTRYTTIVQLITNRESKIPVYIPQKGRAVLKGEGGKKLILTYIDFFPQHQPFQKGDIIYTLGIDGYFPKHQPIAIITDIKDERTVLCKPFENVDYLFNLQLLNLH